MLLTSYTCDTITYLPRNAKKACKETYESMRRDLLPTGVYTSEAVAPSFSAYLARSEYESQALASDSGVPE
jgi:hypothetical protein